MTIQDGAGISYKFEPQMYNKKPKHIDETGFTAILDKSSLSANNMPFI